MSEPPLHQQSGQIHLDKEAEWRSVAEQERESGRRKHEYGGDEAATSLSPSSSPVFASQSGDKIDNSADGDRQHEVLPFPQLPTAGTRRGSKDHDRRKVEVTRSAPVSPTCSATWLTSPTLIRFYSSMNLVVWGTVLVLGQGVLPVLHGCAGVIISLEGIFAAASKNEASIRIFIVLMLLNLVFCTIMGPLSEKGVYLECSTCSNETVEEGDATFLNDTNTVVCANNPFCEQAFRLYGWILIIFGAILQLPIFLFTVGFYFAISRGFPGRQSKQWHKATREGKYHNPVTELVDDDFVSVGPPISSMIRFRPEDVIPSHLSFQLNGQTSVDRWTADPDVKYFNPDLTYL